MKVTRLSVTAVKGLALHHPQHIDITATGAVGDRLFYLVDERDGMVSIAKTGGLVGLSAEYDESTQVLTISEGGTVLASTVAMPTEAHMANFFGFRPVAGHLAPGPWDALLSDRAGRVLRLVKADEPNGGRDVEPLSLLGEASTAELARTAGLDSVDGRRFRMLIEFDGGPPHAEDGWLGRRIRIGTSTIEVGGPVQRCAGTTRNPDTGVVDLRTLALIGDYRGRQESIFGPGFNFGVYASTVSPGRVTVGDEFDLSSDPADLEVMTRFRNENAS